MDKYGKFLLPVGLESVSREMMGGEKVRLVQVGLSFKESGSEKIKN